MMNIWSQKTTFNTCLAPRYPYQRFTHAPLLAQTLFMLCRAAHHCLFGAILPLQHYQQWHLFSIAYAERWKTITCWLSLLVGYMLEFTSAVCCLNKGHADRFDIVWTHDWGLWVWANSCGSPAQTSAQVCRSCSATAEQSPAYTYIQKHWDIWWQTCFSALYKGTYKVQQ